MQFQPEYDPGPNIQPLLVPGQLEMPCLSAHKALASVCCSRVVGAAVGEAVLGAIVGTWVGPSPHAEFTGVSQS